MRHKIDERTAMASPWRRRRMCVLTADGPAPVALRDISATGAFLETNARPALGTRIELRHPDAGTVPADVCGIALDGVAIRFECNEQSVAFALAAITSDMSWPGA